METDEGSYTQPIDFISAGASDGEYIVCDIMEPSQVSSTHCVGNPDMVTSHSATTSSDSSKILQYLQQSVYFSQAVRPPYSLSALITLAITSSRDRHLSVVDIQKFIRDLLAYYQHTTYWETSVKLCLKRGKFMLHQCHCDPKEAVEGEGCYMSDQDLWTVNPHWAYLTLRNIFSPPLPRLKRKSRETETVKNKVAKFSSIKQEDGSSSEEFIVFGDSPEKCVRKEMFLGDNDNHKFCGGNQRLRELYKELTEAPECASISEPPPFTNSLFITLALVSGTGDSLTTTQIVETIAWMFPYFSNFGKDTLRCSILRTLNKKKKAFIKTSSSFDKESSWNIRLSTDTVIQILEKAANFVRKKEISCVWKIYY
uniref:Fork-head domain-containing protein n=1 Tax=Graphocephala atropunctata TaxID=36148 RepID=A0A1B6KR80_9HEMI